MGAVRRWVRTTALMVLASTAMFRAGLRRYESGNLLAGRQ